MVAKSAMNQPCKNISKNKHRKRKSTISIWSCIFGSFWSGLVVPSSFFSGKFKGHKNFEYTHKTASRITRDLPFWFQMAIFRVNLVTTYIHPPKPVSHRHAYQERSHQILSGSHTNVHLEAINVVIWVKMGEVESFVWILSVIFPFSIFIVLILSN